ncbi:MAG: amidase [Rhodospirillaceae bacterium]|nr:amidase [Rhodospirillaceae bacterium]MYB11777.1 amidase [Rhodospirillaceae bacterium]MYI47468.1 amidase [Rhodospirillaceae bacterium]
MSDLWKKTATETVALLKAGAVSPAELLDVLHARIEAVDGAVNALPTLCRDRAMAAAGRADPGSVLAGLPVAIKDLAPVEGVRTTFGSPIFADNVPDHSDYVVERLEARGGVVYAKSNTPEFGAGANTFNPVFGVTRNPWDTRMSAAGSSGGAAVALATGTAWLAHGSDLGGSLRTPAGFNAVVGLRPSPGLVPSGPDLLTFQDLAVEGPMGRTVADVALMLDAMAGADPRDPRSFAPPVSSYAEALREPPARLRIAWTPDLGTTTVDREIQAVCAEAAAGFSGLGGVVEEACPDFAGAYDCFQTLRAAFFAGRAPPLLAAHRDRLKPDVIWNIEKGLALTADDIGRAERERTALYHRVAAFMADYDILACPVMQARPYPVEQTYVEEIDGRKMASYIDWIAITFSITLTGLPVVSLPCGFTEDGLPVGLQLVGRHRGEAALLAAAAQLEDLLGIASRVPIDPIIRH